MQRLTALAAAFILAATSATAATLVDLAVTSAATTALQGSAGGAIMLVPQAQREANRNNLNQLHKLIVMYEIAEGQSPASWQDMVDAGYIDNRESVRCPTREKSRQWRFDYTLLPNLTEQEPARRAIIWDNPGNFADGGMVVFRDGSFEIVRGLETEDWHRLARALANRNDREFVKETFESADVSGFED